MISKSILGMPINVLLLLSIFEIVHVLSFIDIIIKTQNYSGFNYSRSKKLPVISKF